ncbi:MAG: hypothetical protein JST00_01925 [Deltaproteobacteria bacterium]|nr:hypothetical protein [Deltaproteobacteria bacterium]
MARPIPREESPDDEITVERRVRMRPTRPAVPQAVTRRVPVVDSWLIAVARGEVDPDDDPFGGLIPVDDDGNEIF